MEPRACVRAGSSPIGQGRVEQHVGLDQIGTHERAGGHHRAINMALRSEMGGDVGPDVVERDAEVRAMSPTDASAVRARIVER